jgi:hypothetical protein
MLYFHTRVFLLTVIASAATITHGQSPASSWPPPERNTKAWREYGFPEGRFKVSLPAEPTEESLSTKTPNGRLEYQIFTLDTKAASYEIRYYDLTWVPGSDEEIKKLLNGARARILHNFQGQLIAEEDIFLDQHPGREMRVESQNHVIRARCYVAGRRFYLTIFSTTKVANPSVTKFDETFAKAFFDSFKLIGVDTAQEAKLQEKPDSFAQAEPQQVPAKFLVGNAIRKVAPAYPSGAMSYRISGVVMVRPRFRAKFGVWTVKIRIAHRPIFARNSGYGQIAHRPNFARKRGESLYLPAPGILHPQPQGLGGDERRSSS